MEEVYLYRVDVEVYDEYADVEERRSCILLAENYTNAMNAVENYFGDAITEVNRIQERDFSLLVVDPDIADIVMNNLDE